MLHGKHERWSESHLHWTGNHKIPEYFHRLPLLEPIAITKKQFEINRKFWFQRLCSHSFKIYKEWTSAALGIQTWELNIQFINSIFYSLNIHIFTCSSQTPDSSSGAQRIMVLSMEADNNLIGCCRTPSKKYKLISLGFHQASCL